MRSTKEKIRKWIRRVIIIFAILAVVVAALIGTGVYYMTLPGESYAGSLKPLTDAEKLSSDNMKAHVQMLAGKIGLRNSSKYSGLQLAVEYIKYNFDQTGLEVRTVAYEVEGQTYENLVLEIKGSSLPKEIVVVGAHYDSPPLSPGADDNASGTAALLELARILKDRNPARTIRLVAFVNEEPPHFQTENMGSLVYAKQAKQRGDNIVAMLSIESIGYYSDVPSSQVYPQGLGSLYPDKGNFIAFVGNLSSRSLLRRSVGSFRQNTEFPSEGAVLPGWLPGAGWSDHWSFWEQGYPAIMVTDTATFRNPNYHLAADTPEKLDYERMARVVTGLVEVVMDLAMPEKTDK